MPHSLDVPMASSIPPPPSHRLVCLGVSGKSNQGSPEQSAEAVFSRLSGALGPSLSRAVCLTGQEATRRAVTDVLGGEPEVPARFSLVYFSGAANGRGLRVADGYVDGAWVTHQVEHTSAERVLLLLEICAGPRPDAELVPSWVERLASVNPGVGLAAARATRVGAGAEGAGLGRFAVAFLKALDTARGDMDVDGEPFISDRRALDEARAELKRRFGVTHLPEEHGVFGGFPLARCQVKGPIGSAEVLGVALGKAVSVVVRFCARGRAGVPTRLRVELLDATDELLVERVLVVVPTSERHVGRVRARIGREALLEHPVWGPTLELGEVVQVRIRVTLFDSAGRTLDRRVYAHEMGGLVR